jgi:hypothetical protein
MDQSQGNPWAEGWESGTPRVTTKKVPYRKHRLKALGNAIVPACAEWVGRRVMDVFFSDSPQVPGATGR